MLIAVEFVPGIALGLLAGALIDRITLRPVLVASNVARACLLALIPILALTDNLMIEQLYAIGLAVGVFGLAFDVAYVSIVPSLVRREQLVDANAKMTLSYSLAQIAGPLVGGGLVAVLTAPIAIAVDAASFIVAAALFVTLQLAGPPRGGAAARSSITSDIREGLRVVLGNRSLVAIAGSTATLNFFVSILLALFVLYVTCELGLGAQTLGGVLASYGFGSVLGAIAVSRITARLGIGRAVIGSIVVAGLFEFLIPAASLLRGVSAPLLALSYFIIGFTGPAYTANLLSIRQAVTPSHLLGRVNATMRILVTATFPLGALFGGALGARVGIEQAIVVSACGVLAAAIWIIRSPIRTLREIT